MQNIVTTDEQIRAVIPNIQIAVEGQVKWTDRLSSFLDEAVSWLETMVSPVRIIEKAGLLDQAAAIVIWRAWARAVHSLDIVATPNGFAVVSNQNLAPASQARSEAARENAVRQADGHVCSLLDRLRNVPDWTVTRQAKRFHTLFPDPRELQHQLGEDMPPFGLYARRSAELIMNESILGANTLSSRGLKELRRIASSILISGCDGVAADDLEILDLARSAVIVMLCSDPCDRITLRKICDRIRMTMDQSDDSSVAALWKTSSLYRAFKMKPYENKKDSGGYFF